MKIALIQMNSKTADIKANFEKMKKYIKTYSSKAVTIIFPELAITGINCKDYFTNSVFFEEQNRAIETLLSYSDKIDIITGYAEKTREGLYSSIILLSKNSKKVLCRKKVLEDYEKKYFISGEGSQEINYKGRLLTVTLDNIRMHKSDYLLNLRAENFQIDTIKKRARAKYQSEIKLNPACISGSLIFDGGSFITNKNNQYVVKFPDLEEKVIIFDDEAPHNEIKAEKNDETDRIINALVFGMKDFCEKTGFKKAVLGLSGGIDSALSAVLACKALGSENVLGITMPSEYSSEGSIKDSFDLAENLGMKCIEVPIKPLFNTFINDIQGKKYNDLAEENLQSRLRGIILMSYSNRDGYLLLSTGNKSEVAMGYCTLYGDTCGGLNLISDIYKTDVYKLAKRINKNKEIIPQNTIIKPRSAELRPNQKDSDSLPDYEVLDRIIKLYFEQRIYQEEISYLYPDEPVEEIISRILRAEFKRKQMTAGFKVSKRSFVSDIDYPIM